jgi:hypothetical protein
VKGLPSIWRSTCAHIVALSLALAVAATPSAAAASSEPVPPSIDFNAAVVKVVAAGRLASKTAARAQTPARPADDAKPDSASFFRTPLGLAVIAVVGAGTGYAVYSAKHDRIHSTAR